jgi:hypothetical protein
VLADALYGSDSRLRRMLEARRQPYVLAVRFDHHLRFLTQEGLVQTDPAELADEVPAKAWSAHAAGEGSKGIRLYDWARIALPWIVDAGFERWVLIRRSTHRHRARVLALTKAAQKVSWWAALLWLLRPPASIAGSGPRPAAEMLAYHLA